MINNHVVSLDIAKQLYEAGIKIESEFWWEVGNENVGAWVTDSKKGLGGTTMYPAPLASELGELLPQYLILEDGVTKYSCNLEVVRSSAWRFYYGDPQHNYSIKFTATGGASEADARAEFVIYLKNLGKI